MTRGQLRSRGQALFERLPDGKAPRDTAPGAERAHETSGGKPSSGKPSGGEVRADAVGAARVIARLGLVARGVVYVVMGWLAIDVARGRNQGQVNQKGALADVASRPGGVPLLIVLAAGLAAYSLWRLWQAVTGSSDHGRSDSGSSAGSRIKSLVRGVVYGFLCATAIELVTGSSRTGQAQQQEDVTAHLLRNTAGRWLIAVAGLVVLGVGIFMIAEGVRRRFLDELQTGRMRPPTRRAVTTLGVIGSVARGIVVGTAGGLVIDAAITADPSKSTGLDGALRTLAQTPAGPWLLGGAAVGLVVFGVFSMICARWVRI